MLRPGRAYIFINRKDEAIEALQLVCMEDLYIPNFVINTYNPKTTSFLENTIGSLKLCINLIEVIRRKNRYQDLDLGKPKPATARYVPFVSLKLVRFHIINVCGPLNKY